MTLLLQEIGQFVCCCCCFQSAKNLSVVFDMLLSIAAHVVNPIRTATLELRRIT